MKDIIKKLELAENELTGEPSEENAAEALLLIKDVLQVLRQTDVLSSRATTVYECRAALLKQLFPVKHTNGYPCEAVPKATLLSLPQLMGVPDSPIA